MRSLLIVAFLASCGGNSATPDMAEDLAAGLYRHAQCTNAIGVSLGACATGLICTVDPPCTGPAIDPISICVLPGEITCAATTDMSPTD